jgi:peptidyl-prolyl cis-trans isomerase D
MLDVMRRQSTLIYFIFGAIILIFAVNFGPGSSGCARGMAQPVTWAAKVNGEVVRHQDFAALYGQRMDALRRMSDAQGQPFDPMMAERMGVRRVVLNQLVERRLVAQEAARHGIAVSDEALLSYLRRTYGVHRVSYANYEAWVQNSFGSSVPRFEALAREDAAGELLVRAVRDGQFVSELELKHMFEREHDRAQVQYVRFDVAEQRRRVAAPTEALIAHALEHDSAAIEAQYVRDRAHYQTPARAHLRQIVRVLDAQASAADVEAARKLLVDLGQQVQGGADFEALARAHSQDAASRERGGDLGTIDRGTLAPALEQVAFGLEPGAVAAEPVRTPEGLHLVQTAQLEPAGVRPLDAVRREVATAMLQQRAAEAAARAEAQALLARLKGGATLASVTVPEEAEATALKPTTSAHKLAARPVRRTSGWTRRTDEAIARIGASPELHRAIFALTPAQPVAGDVFQVEDSFYVTVLQQREEPLEQDFAQAREALLDEALASRQRRVLTDWLDHLRAQAKVELNAQLLQVPAPTGADTGAT